MRLPYALFFLPLLGAVSELPALCRTYKFPNWELTAEGIYVDRRGIRKQNIINPSMCGCRSILTTATSTHDLDWEPGVRGFIRYMPSKDRTIELSGTWIQDFESTVERTATTFLFNFRFPDVSYDSDFFNAQKVVAHYNSRFYDSEINYWGNFSPRNVNFFSLSGVIGIRSMFLGEHYKVTFSKNQSESSYFAKTKNYIVGLQAGGSLQWNPTCHWTLDFLMKTGLMADFATAKQVLRSQNDTIKVKNFNPNRQFKTMFWEGSFFLYYRFRYNISTHAGYRLLGVWGLALAPTQLTGQEKPTSGDKVDKTGKIYLHFITLGLNFDF